MPASQGKTEKGAFKLPLSQNRTCSRTYGKAGWHQGSDHTAVFDLWVQFLEM